MTFPHDPPSFARACRYCAESTAPQLPPRSARLLAVSCGWDDDSQRVRIDVWNTADPLGGDELGRAFEWGFRGAAAEAGGVDGSGIGLSIVQQLVQLLGGTVELANRPMADWAWNRCLDEAGRADDDDSRLSVPPMGVNAQVLLPRA